MNSPRMQSSVPFVQSKIKPSTIPFSDFGRYFMVPPRKRTFSLANCPGIKTTIVARWIYVTDTETGDVIGGAQWNIYKENPYATERPMLTLYWLPEGRLKDMLVVTGPLN
jgi:hypothetical protein